MLQDSPRVSEKSVNTKPLRFLKGEIRIPCPHHDGEQIVKVSTVDSSKPKLLCLECIMENPDYIKSHKSQISPVEKYLSELVDSLEEMREGKQAKLDQMPKNVMEFYENYYRVRDTFKDCIDAEKNEVGGIFRETIEGIVDGFVDAGNILKGSLDQQLSNFEGNSKHLRDLIDEHYKISGVPSESEVLKSVNSKREKELITYLSSLAKLQNSENEHGYQSAFDILHHQILHNVKHTPKIVVKDSVKKKLDEIQDLVQSKLEDIVAELKMTIEQNKVDDISKLTVSEARREVSGDGLCAFMEFENDQKKVSFKLHKKIPVKSNSTITCILNLANKFIAVGARNGSVQVYQISTSHLVAELEKHTDVVTCLASLNKIHDKDNLILCSGSANLDGRILVWNVFDEDSTVVELQGHVGNITAIASLEDGKLIASAAHDGNIILWNVKSGEQVYKTVAHSSMISALRFSASRNSLISAGWDGNIKIWSVVYSGLQEGLSKKQLALERYIVADTPIVNILIRQVRGNFIVSIGSDNSIKVWNSETGELEGDFANHDTSRAEVCLLENKFKYGKADFITLNTAVKEDLVLQTGMNEGAYRTVANQEAKSGYELSSFFTQPRVQIVQNNKKQLRLVKGVNCNLGDSLGSVLNVYDIV